MAMDLFLVKNSLKSKWKFVKFFIWKEEKNAHAINSPFMIFVFIWYNK